jgi:pimeloyl-ACP methyl ester carboxylesterase
MAGSSEAPDYTAGSGSTLVLLHGIGGTWHIWKPVLPMLQKRHQVVALTLPGHLGGVELPRDVEPTVDALAETLLADLHRRGIYRAHVVGNSLGGWLALELARRGFALSVTALSPAGGWRTQEDYQAIARPFRIVFLVLPLLIVLIRLFLGFAWVRRKLNAKAMEHGDRVPAREVLLSMKSMGKTRILPKLLYAMGRDGPIKPMRATGVPMRIAWCGRDKVIPFQTYGVPMLESVREAEPLIMSGVGHVPMYDDPEQVARLILSMTQKVDGVVNA